MNRLKRSICLLSGPVRCQQMDIAGRTVVERDFSAAVCVPRILRAMKQAVDAA